MHILLTRPLEDSKDLILKFKSLGHSVSHLPVIEIKKIEHEKTLIEKNNVAVEYMARCSTFACRVTLGKMGIKMIKNKLQIAIFLLNCHKGYTLAR